MRSGIIALLCGSLLSGLSWADKNKSQARLGDLLVIAESVDGGEQGQSGYHTVSFRVRFRNVGKEAICITFKVELESTLGVETRGTVRFYDKDNPQGHQDGLSPGIHMLLPGNELESDVVFTNEKNGVEPRTLVITQTQRVGSQSCGARHSSYSPIPPARISVKNIPPVAALPAQR